MFRRGFLGILAFPVASMLSGCSAGPSAVAYENKTFYEYGAAGTGADAAAAFEKPFPALDLAAQKPNPEFMGVTVLGGLVHLSRPKNWTIRNANNAPGQRSIQYVSSNEYMVAIWERPDFASDLWRDVIARYVDDTKSLGNSIVGGPVPIATWNAQGRAFLVQRSVAAAKAPLTATIREYVVRSEGHVLLVQIAYQEDQLPALSPELVRFLSTLRVE